MRGSPLLQCLAGVLAFALFAIPLVRLTAPRAERMAPGNTTPDAAEAAGAKHTFIRIRFAHAPRSLSLRMGDKELLPRPPTPLTSPIETEASIPLSTGSAELALAVSWPEGTPDTAVTVELEPDELDTRRETRWSAGPTLKEILNFKW